MSTGRQKAPDQLNKQVPSRIKDLPIPVEPKPAPRMPSGLTAGAKAVWRRFWASPLSHAVDPEADYNRLQRWMELLDEREDLRSRIYGSEWRPDQVEVETFGGEKLVLGTEALEALAEALGIRPAGPTALQARLTAIENQLLKIEESFGISPQARFRLQIRYETAQEKAQTRRKREETPAVPDPADTVVDLDKL